jgi:hypothetical protein
MSVHTGFYNHLHFSLMASAVRAMIGAASAVFQAFGLAELRISRLPSPN